jgi:cytochrome b6-f complex iron-sulfur subunit
MKIENNNNNRADAPVFMDRRSFLIGSGSACLLIAASAGGLTACDDDEGGTLAEGVFPVGSVDDFEVGSVRRFSEGPFFVLRDEAGFWAMTAICTHEQCTVNTGTDKLPCPCHGSVFDFNGNVVHGPASKPLSNLSVAIDGDNAVSVDSSKIVDAGTRVAPSA